MPSAQVGNGFDPTLTKRFVGEIEKHFETIASYTGEHMKRCKDVRELVTRVYDTAKDAGIPKKELKRVINLRKLDRQKQALLDDLEGDEAETVEQIQLALGDLADLPLGEAAVAAAPKARKPRKSAEQAKADADALDDVAGDA